MYVCSIVYLHDKSITDQAWATNLGTEVDLTRVLLRSWAERLIKKFQDQFLVRLPMWVYFLDECNFSFFACLCLIFKYLVL